jgi:hypothetical protein
MTDRSSTESMARVNLELLSGPYQPALRAGHVVDSYRLITDVSIYSTVGWSPLFPGVVDTGAPLCLFPPRIWRAAQFESIGRVEVGGIIRTPECMISATLAVIKMAICDRNTKIGPIQAHVLLADSDDVPTLIGMREVLTQLILCIDVRNHIAYVEDHP